MNINIKGAKTHDSGKDLCQTCKYAHIVRGHAQSEQIVECSQLDKIIRWRVAECNQYIERGTLSLTQMREIAFVMEFGKGGKIGFVRARDFEKKNGYGSAIDWDD